jgi:hypothetical protein
VQQAHGLQAKVDVGIHQHPSSLSDGIAMCPGVNARRSWGLTLKARTHTPSLSKQGQAHSPASDVLASLSRGQMKGGIVAHKYGKA